MARLGGIESETPKPGHDVVLLGPPLHRVGLLSRSSDYLWLIHPRSVAHERALATVSAPHFALYVVGNLAGVRGFSALRLAGL